MGRPLPRPKKIDGRIGFMPSDGVFLASREIVKLIPLVVRIADVVEYPGGTLRGGHATKEPFPALVLEVRGTKSGEWKRGSKPWAPNITALWVLHNRFGSEVEWWIGQEITLDLTPRRHPGGGAPVAGIYVVPLDDERTEEQMMAKMARALRGECPYQQEPAPERQPGDDDEPFDVTRNDIPDDHGD